MEFIFLLSPAFLRLFSKTFYMCTHHVFCVDPMTPTAPLDLQRLAAALTAELPGCDLFERLALVAARIPGRIVFTTSFGIEDQALTHAVLTQNLPVEVVTFDTGRLFP